MSSRKVDMSIPNVPYPTASRGLVLGADGKLPLSVFPPGVGGGITSITDTTPSNLTGMLKANGTDVDVAIAGTDYATPGTVNTGLGLKVDKDSVVVAATRIVASKLLAGDLQPAFRILGDGTHSWGPGALTAPDVTLYRHQSAVLRTNGSLRADGFVDVDFAGIGGQLRFGSGVDTNLYRASAGQLKTDGALQTGGAIYGKSDVFSYQGSAGQIRLSDGALAGGTIIFGSAGDTTLYRSAADNLKTDDTFYALQLVASNGTVWFGSQIDAGINRLAPNILSTNGELRMGTPNVTADGNKYYFGPSYDTSLYRSAAGVLKTDGQFVAGSAISSPTWIGADINLSGQTIIGDLSHWLGGGFPYPGVIFGSAADTRLYRAAASRLKTDGEIHVGTNVVVDASGTGGRLYLGGAGDTTLYRSAAGVLKTDGQLVCKSSGTYTPGLLIDGGGSNHLLYVRKVAGDAYPVFMVANDGSLFMGPGGGSGPDVVLSRLGSTSFGVNRGISIDRDGAGYGIAFGSTGDAYIYRSGASALRTNGSFHADGGISLLSGADTVELQGELERVGGAVRFLKILVNGTPYRIKLQ